MPDRRSRIALTDEEQRDLLHEAKTLYIASIGPDGRPHLVPMWFAPDDEGLVAFTTYGTSQKVRNLERDPRITVLVEAGDAYEELRGVSIDGRAEIVRDLHVTARVRELAGAQHAGQPRPEADPDAEPPAAVAKRVTVRVHPERVRSWDHRKLR
ncbi:MAG: TIGR03618 family F420-dependent PPOX class oxidoreductase [Dehalococcoidia bacterium]